MVIPWGGLSSKTDYSPRYYESTTINGQVRSSFIPSFLPLLLSISSYFFLFSVQSSTQGPPFPNFITWSTLLPGACPIFFDALKELTGRFILMGQHGLLFWTEGYPIKLKSALFLFLLPLPSVSLLSYVYGQFLRERP